MPITVRRARWALALALFALARPGLAELVTDAPPGSSDTRFHQRLTEAVAALARSPEPLLRELHAAVMASRGKIIVRPLTDDPATWSSDGDRSRAHTEPADGKPKRLGRSQPTDAIVYLNPEAVEEGRSYWKGGVLVHELVHALDLSSGRYNPDNRVRERRAVFIQNLWRDRAGHPLRESYHGYFPTPDYQIAVKRGEVAQLGRHLFTGPDFPAQPAR